MAQRQTSCILIVDDNPVVRERLAQVLRAGGEEVITAATGEQAFGVLRDWSKPVDWLYTKARLPGLIDGWILADAFHDTHPSRVAIIAADRDRTSSRGDVVLGQESPASILHALRDCQGLHDGQAEGAEHMRYAA